MCFGSASLFCIWYLADKQLGGNSPHPAVTEKLWLLFKTLLPVVPLTPHCNAICFNPTPPALGISSTFPVRMDTAHWASAATGEHAPLLPTSLSRVRSIKLIIVLRVDKVKHFFSKAVLKQNLYNYCISTSKTRVCDRIRQEKRQRNS